MAAFLLAVESEPSLSHWAAVTVPSCVPLMQRFPTFLTLQPFNTVPHAVVTPTIKLFWLLLHGCNAATVMNRNVKHLGFSQ